MAYRTLLVHLPADEADAVLDVAVRLARDHGAHLTGLHMIPRQDAQYAFEIPPSVLRESEARMHVDASRAGERFEAVTKERGLDARWRVLDGVDHPVERALIALGNTVDLIVAGQTRDRGRRGARGELTARTLAGGGRPMLLVPPERGPDTFGERVFVAWDGQRAATRALFGALPLLRRAGAVRVQRFDGPQWNRTRTYAASEELVDTLERHGVTVELFHDDARAAEIGADLLRLADDWGADTLVAGGQEQGAAREYLLGSTTRYLLEHLSMPMITSC